MNAELIRWLLGAHAFVTLFMTGLIWFVQIVHYPLFAYVGQSDFMGYQKQHMRKTAWLVAGPMLLELGLAAVLAWSLGGSLAWSGLVLLGIIWLSTALGQVPMHGRLERGFDQAAHLRLIRGNWVRSISWTLRAMLALWMLANP